MPETNPSQPISLLNAGPRSLPNNRDAEVAVLGCLLLDPRSALDHARTQLSFEEGPTGFHDPHHQTIFDAMLEMEKEAEGGQIAFDLITLGDHLDRQGHLEETGGRVYLAELYNSVATAANSEQYVDIVRQNAVLRRLIALCVDTVDQCYERKSEIREMLDTIERGILEVTGLAETHGLVSVESLVRDAVQYLDQLRTGELGVLGVPTGYPDLDKLITGLQPGHMYVIAARPSIGKTALALNMAAHVALGENGLPVGIFSLEMPAKQLVLRLLCSEARVGQPEIRERSLPRARWDDIGSACDRLHDAQIVIDDSGDIDLLELKSKARRMKREYDIQVLYIDYLQLIRGSGRTNQTRENEVSAMSGAIKAIAKELSIPVVVLAQLNRQAEQQGQRPKLSHLRESGAIEQDADVVMLLHREREAQYAQEPGSALDAELIIAKNRNGQTGTVSLTFLPAFTRFESRVRVENDDIPQNM